MLVKGATGWNKTNRAISVVRYENINVFFSEINSARHGSKQRWELGRISNMTFYRVLTHPRAVKLVPNVIWMGTKLWKKDIAAFLYLWWINSKLWCNIMAWLFPSWRTLRTKHLEINTSDIGNNDNQNSFEAKASTSYNQISWYHDGINWSLQHFKRHGISQSDFDLPL